jgi:hypothetical protein
LPNSLQDSSGQKPTGSRITIKTECVLKRSEW